MTFIGIDPGAKGALAVVVKTDFCKTLAGVYPFQPSAYRDVLSSLKRSERQLLAAVEDVHAMPKQGVSSMFSFGRSKGIVEGMLIAMDIPYTLVRPQDWKKFHGLLLGKGADKRKAKRASIDRAHDIFPRAAFYPTRRCTVESDGMAEAVLMADFLAESFFSEKTERDSIDKV